MSEGVELSVARPAGISYVHIPAKDRRDAAAFYAAVFGWEIGGDPDDPSFHDGTGHVIGRWVTDQAPTADDGIRPYIYVESVTYTLARATGLGATIARPPYAEGNLTVATFRDPSGNTIGVWQQTAA